MTKKLLILYTFFIVKKSIQFFIKRKRVFDEQKKEYDRKEKLFR